MKVLENVKPLLRLKKKRFVYYKYLESIIKFHPKKQFSFNFIIENFLDKIEFDKNNLFLYLQFESQLITKLKINKITIKNDNK